MRIPPPGTFSGTFAPGSEFEPYRPLFDAVFERQNRVDGADASIFLAAWSDWHQSLAVIEKLGLTFGPDRIPIESLEINTDWRITFQPALWWAAAGPDPADGQV